MPSPNPAPVVRNRPIGSGVNASFTPDARTTRTREPANVSNQPTPTPKLTPSPKPPTVPTGDTPCPTTHPVAMGAAANQQGHDGAKQPGHVPQQQATPRSDQ